jgi:hypothetical protein
LALKDLPESDFTLSAFGFPEPEGVVWNRPQGWYLWIALCAFGALAVALLVRFWRRRYHGPDANKKASGT